MNEPTPIETIAVKLAHYYPETFASVDCVAAASAIVRMIQENERLKEELAHIQSGTAKDVHIELNVYKADRENLKQRIRELESQCAAMREVIECACFYRPEESSYDDRNICTECGVDHGHEPSCHVGNALATDAGREVLARLEAQKEEIQHLKDEWVKLRLDFYELQMKAKAGKQLFEALETANRMLESHYKVTRFQDQHDAMAAWREANKKEGAK